MQFKSVRKSFLILNNLIARLQEFRFASKCQNFQKENLSLPENPVYMPIFQKTPLNQIPFFSKIFQDYIAQNAVLEPFFQFVPRKETFGKIIAQKQFPQEKRNLLYQIFQEQYERISLYKTEKENIEALLSEKTFTVTTAHQPSIFFGELYFVYKALTTLRLAEFLRALMPAYHFVPIFWLGSEDHDFAEISHFRLFGKTYQWHTEQKGAVGRMKTAEIAEILSVLPEKIPVFETAYTQYPTLAQATRYALHEFFGKKGLLVLDGDDAKLKKALIPVIQNELQEQKTEFFVKDTSLQLTRLGYHAQAQARPINFFYLDEGLRERIERKGDFYEVLHTPLRFSETEILQLTEKNPEKFSPNALLRPIYQELVLPNLAYIGGPGEIAYWLQLKSTFEHFRHLAPHLTMPMLLPRNFALVLTQNQSEKINKLQLSVQDFFQESHTLKKLFLSKLALQEFSLPQEKETILQAFESIKQKTAKIDKTLLSAVEAEEQKTLKSLEHLEKRIQKAEEKKHENELQQVLSLKEKLFPDGALQERKDNFLNFYLNYATFLEDLHQIFEPFSNEFYIIQIQ